MVSSKRLTTGALTDCWCETHINVIETNFTWTIKNFSFCNEKPGEALESTIFSATHCDTLKWRMQFYPTGNNADNKDYVSLFLHLVNCDKPAIKADFMFCILDKDGREMNEHKTTEKWHFYQGRQSGFTKFAKREYVLDTTNGLLHKDKLRILCKIKSATGDVDRICQDAMNPQPPHLLNEMSNEFEQQFNQENFSDVVLNVKDKVKFYAHKVILAARSPVFSAMFKHNMKEQMENIVNIRDLEPETFEAMLKFMYSGKVKNIESKATTLLGAADKYALDGLKRTCEQVLCASLAIGNAAEYLYIAEMHNALILKEKVLCYIKTHLRDVVDTTGFKALLNSNPSLLEELLKFVSKR